MKNTADSSGGTFSGSLAAFLRDYLDSGDFDRDFRSISPIQRIESMRQLLGYVTPRLKSVDARVENQSATTDHSAAGMILRALAGINP